MAQQYVVYFNEPKGSREGQIGYPTAVGFSHRRTLNEELDTASFNIIDLRSEIEGIAPLDYVFAYDGDSLVFAMLLEKFKKSYVRINEEKVYKYEISLVSLTKLLENSVLPNLSIKQRKSNKKTILDVIESYVDLYYPKTRKYESTDVVWECPLLISDRLSSRFGAIDCPEMQWNKPTLREAIHDLLLVDDCLEIVRYEQGRLVLDYIDLAERKGEISDSISDSIYQEETSNSLGEYASTLVSTFENVTQSDKEGMDDTVSICEQIGFRNSEAPYLFSPRNIRIETTMPIYEIVKATACRFVYVNGKWRYVECDITDAIRESQEVLTLPYLRLDPIFEQEQAGFVKVSALSIDSLGKFSNTCMEYKRGSRYIEGFSKETTINRWLIGEQQKYMIEHLDCAMMFRYCLDTSIAIRSYSVGESNGVQYKYIAAAGAGAPAVINTTFGFGDSAIGTMTFRIEYKTLASIRSKMSKPYLPKHQRETADSQVNSYSDSYRLGKFGYSKVSRLGNDDTEVRGRAKSLSDIPQIGQTYKGDVIYSVEASKGLNCFDYSFLATKVFVYENYFTAVRAKIRSWRIVDGREALERNEVCKSYLQFSYRPKSDNHDGLSSYATIEFDKMLSPLFGKIANISISDFMTSLNYAKARTSANSGLESYSLPLTTILSGNSILMKFSAYDNYAYGMSIPEYDSTGGGWKQWQHKYVDENGECEYAYASFYSKSDRTAGGRIESWPLYPYLDGYAIDYDSELSDDMEASWNYPKTATTSGYHANSYVKLDKDNSEILSITTQFEFCSDDKSLVFCEEFLTRQPSVRSCLVLNCTAQQFAARYSPKELLKLDTIDYDTYQNYSQAGYVEYGGFEDIPEPTAANQAIAFSNGIALSIIAEDTGLPTFYKWVSLGGGTNVYRKVLANFVPDGEEGSGPYEYDGKFYMHKAGSFFEIPMKGELRVCELDAPIDPCLCGKKVVLSEGHYSATDCSILPTADSDRVHLTFGASSSSSYGFRHFALADAEGNVLFAWSGRQSESLLKPRDVYINLVHSPDDSIMEEDGITKSGTI